MLSLCQRVINKSKNCTLKIAPYAFSLMFVSGRKTYTNTSRSLDLPYDQFYNNIVRVPQRHDQVVDYFINKVKKYQTADNMGRLLVDFSRFKKDKDTKIPNTTWDRDGRINHVNNGFSIGFIGWTNGKICIPLNFEYWLNRRDAQESYSSKKDIAKQLILDAQQKLETEGVIVDGEFINMEMLEFYEKHSLSLIGRMARNRRITTKDGACHQLQHHPALRLKGNNHTCTVYAEYKGKWYYFTAVKQKTRSGKVRIVFIISSSARSSKDHAAVYKMRWWIEKFFRTIKQNFGAEDCQSRSASQQRNHLYAAMFNYVVAQELAIAKKKKSPEKALRVLKRRNNPRLFSEYIDWIETYAMN